MQADLLLVDEQLSPRPEGSANAVQRVAQRVAGAAAVPGGGLPDALAAHGELVRCHVDDVERVHHRTSC